MIRGLSDALLPVARGQIKSVYGKEEYKNFFNGNGDPIKIVEVYENYTSAFGMIVNQSGFKSVFAMYNEKGTNSDGEKKLITQLLYNILRTQTGLIQENTYQECDEKIKDGLHDNDNYEDLFKEASIALKRAIRTFEIVKK
ncbi:hypothetical protein FACS1894174_07430 [Bacteroidia bacterium]|nr:hypothetical protein FACS1894203_4130 [Bacteroidia bacterium]GHV22595.1 hypothetical protein FACS1894174_07430 [Bacteroidia bacterium]